MPLDPSFVGRSYPDAARYSVGREALRAFAAAIGSTDPVHTDPAAARAAGHRDVIAPPTFAIVVAMRAQEALVSDPALGLDYARLVHGDQSFAHVRPITAGDELVAALHVDAIRAAAGNDMLTVRCEIADADGAPVSTARSLLVVRGER